MLGVEFHPLEKHTIVTFGRSHITFWSTEGGVFTRKAGVFEVRVRLNAYTRIAFYFQYKFCDSLHETFFNFELFYFM